MPAAGLLGSHGLLNGRRAQGVSCKMAVSFRRRAAAAAALISFTLAALPAPALATGLNLAPVATGFDQPVFVTNAGDSRLFVVEKGGRIKIVGGGTFLDISAMVSTVSEQGLLGLAFHPSYASNGLFYVFYNRRKDGKSVVAEFKRSSSDPDKANRNSKRVVLIMGQPYGNHNGGWIAFKGSYLYIAKGDGGSGGDPGNRAQDLNHLQGKILRINPPQERQASVHDSVRQPICGRCRQGRDLVVRSAQPVALLVRSTGRHAVLWRRGPG